MNKKITSLFMLAALMLASCGGDSGSDSTSNPSSSGDSSSRSPESSLSSSESESSRSDPSSSSEEPSSSSSEEQSSSVLKATYAVSFFDGDTLESIAVVSVEEGGKVARPQDPTKHDYAFLGWYKDSDLTEEFDFDAPIYENTAVFAKFGLVDYFEGFEPKFTPNYSPLVPLGQYFEGDEDVDLLIEARDIPIEGVISPREILFTGAFRNLSAKNCAVDGKTIRIETSGSLVAGKGYVTLARQATLSDAFVTCVVDIGERSIGVDEYGYRLANEENAVYFTVNMQGMRLNNPNNLTPEQYLNAALSNMDDYFRLEGGDGFTFVVTSIADSFTSFDGKLLSPKAIDEACAKEIAELSFVVAGQALDLGVDQRFKIDLCKPASKTSVTLSYSGLDSYSGEFETTLFGAKATDNFKQNASSLLSDPVNGNAIISFEGCNTKLTSVTVVSDTLIRGKFEVTMDTAEPKIAQISLAPLPGDSPFAFVEGNFDQASIPAMELTAATLGYDTKTSGTITQTAASSYKGVRSVIEHYAFEEAGNSEIADIVNKATNIGKIGYYLYSGNTTSAGNALGDLLGDDSLRAPTNVIMETLQTIFDELQKIESQIDSLGEQLSAIEEELKSIGQEALLSNFLDSYSVWGAFVSDYYTPLRNAINDYSNYYFRYFYDMVVTSSSTADAANPVITVYYDVDGNVAFPDEHLAFSVDGKSLDLKATKQVTIPELYCALAGLRANGGHVYSDIESDIVADLMSRGNMDEALVADLVKSIRFLAMKNYFSSLDKITGFTNTFTDFCNAFTNSEFDTSLHATFTPLDSFVTMLETIFNFGFEIEPDLNIVCSKIASTYYCAKSILNYATIINNGEIATSKYETLDKAVKAELTSTRFHHENDENGNIFCYATNSYVRYRLDQIGISGGSGGYSGNIARVPYGEEYEYDKNIIGEDEFSSIQENDLKLMRLKVKLYNRVRKTAYTFKEYLVKVGMVPNDQAVLKNLFGIVFGIDGVVSGEETKELTYATKFSSGGFTRYGNQTGYSEFSTDPADILGRGFTCSALKGKLYSLDDDQVYTGLLGLSVDYDKDPYYYLPFLATAYWTGILKTKSQEGQAAFTEPTSCYAYFINFEPLNA